MHVHPTFELAMPMDRSEYSQLVRKLTFGHLDIWHLSDQRSLPIAKLQYTA